jgi:hypothetical protein
VQPCRPSRQPETWRSCMWNFTTTSLFSYKLHPISSCGLIWLIPKYTCVKATCDYMKRNLNSALHLWH